MKRSLNQLSQIFIKLCLKNLKLKKVNFSKKDILNFTHQKIRSNDLNKFRLKIINEVNKNKEVRGLYYKVSKPILDISDFKSGTSNINSPFSFNKKLTPSKKLILLST